MADPAELIRDAIHAWIREDVGNAVRMTLHPHQRDFLVERILAALTPQHSPEDAAVLEPLTDTYVQKVPDKCDRILWRGSYHHLPLKAAAPEAPR